MMANFFERQIPVIGKKCQESLKNAKVLVAGVGGLGTNVSEILVRNGVGELYIVDDDVVSETDIHRQILYDVEDVGKKKVDVAEKKLKMIGFGTKIHSMCQHVNEDFKLPPSKIVVDCFDNANSKILLSNLAAKEKIPFVHGGVNGYFGQVLTLNGRSLNDVLSFEDKNEAIFTLLQTVSLTASIQAMEVIKIICGGANDLIGRIIFLDLLNYDLDVVDVENV